MPQTRLVRLAMKDLAWMTEELTQAFVSEVPASHLFTGNQHRARTRYFMRCSAAYALQFGECYTTPERLGVALWLTPGNTAMTLPRMHAAGMLSAPLHMGMRGFLRFMRFAGLTDRMHKAAIAAPHYYLFALGVRPSNQGRGGGGLLVGAMLDRIDEEGLPTYLETQDPHNVALYQRLGFQGVAEAAFPGLGGLRNWGMLRPARAEGAG